MQTTTALAATFETTPRTLRKFLRSDASGIESVGKGARYTLPTAKREVNSLKKKFDAWTEAQAERKAAKDAAEEVSTPATDEDAPETIDTLDELEGPSDEDLADIDA